MDFYSASSRKQQSAVEHVAPLGHIMLISIQLVFAFSLDAACLAEKQQVGFIVFVVLPDWRSNPKSTTLRRFLKIYRNEINRNNDKTSQLAEYLYML